MGNGSETPGSTSLGDKGAQGVDLVTLNGSDLFIVLKWALELRQNIESYLRAGLDSLNGGIVELARVTLERVEGVGALGASELTLVEAAGVNIVDPAQVRGEALGADGALEGDDVAVLSPGLNHGLGSSLLESGSSEAAGSSCEQRELLETDHCNCR